MNTTQANNQNVNLLLIDRIPGSLDLLTTTLHRHGYQTRQVNSGAEAISIALSGWAELILLNIMLPNTNPYQVCQQLKADAQTRAIPVIFIGAADISQIQQAFAAGGVDCISQSCEFQEILVRIANQIAIKSNNSEIIRQNEQLKQQLQLEIDRRKQAQDRLFKISLQDPITGFGNRNSLIARLKQGLKITERQPDYCFALILLECDRFKHIKHIISHIDSNQLLMTIANAIDSCLPESALLYRLEGEEFGIFLDNIREINSAIAVVEKIQHKLTLPFKVKQRQILVNANIGIAIGNQDYQDPDRLFNDADLAMQQARSRSGRYQIFEPEMYIQLQKDTEFSNYEIALKQAIKRQEFVNYYLPIISLKTRQTVELEALVRWHHPEQGVILPQEFIDPAEKMGLMNAIGNLVLRQGCHHINHWQSSFKGRDNLGICINLSAKQLFHPSLLSKVEMILKKSKIQGHHLKFDLGEAVVIEHPKSAIKILRELKKRQVRLCLDNFGVGYSSLTCLHRFQFDELKIDRSLIAHIGQENPNLEQETSVTLLLKQIMEIAHQMKMDVTATGIENNYQLNLLRKLKCDRGQGYLISQLLDRDAVEHFLLT
ncbi:EAL domain-containing protein [Pleurocapsales cyanobacterium LEGE 10410]|nr:EAL domain-containing protein [Pleurocapsales cyanobacterium LEGE 10410]